MSTLVFFKSIHGTWKLTIFVVVFYVWPLSSYLIFHTQPSYFAQLELLKLTLLSSAIAAPFLVLNSIFFFSLYIRIIRIYVPDMDKENILAASTLFSAGITTLILSVSAIMFLLDAKYSWVLVVIAVLEIAFLLVGQ